MGFCCLFVCLFCFVLVLFFLLPGLQLFLWHIICPFTHTHTHTLTYLLTSILTESNGSLTKNINLLCLISIFGINNDCFLLCFVCCVLLCFLMLLLSTIQSFASFSLYLLGFGENWSSTPPTNSTTKCPKWWLLPSTTTL